MKIIKKDKIYKIIIPYDELKETAEYDVSELKPNIVRLTNDGKNLIIEFIIGIKYDKTKYWETIV